MSLPTLFLGTSATVNGDEFNFHEGIVSIPTPVNTLDAVNKLYVDEMIQLQTDRIDTMLSGAGVDLNQLKEVSDYAAALNAAEQASLESAVVSLSSTIATLQSYVDTTKSDLMAADITILSAASAETSARMFADSALNGRADDITGLLGAYKTSNNARSTGIEASVVD